MAAAAPQRQSYKCPFPLTGEPKTMDGRTYTLMRPEDCRTFREMADSMEGFHLHHDKDGVLAWDKTLPGEPMKLVKVFGVFDCPPSMLYDLLQDPIYRGEWDESRLEAFEICRLDGRQDIGYYAGKAVRPVADREFVNQRVWHTAYNNEYVIFNTSVEHASVQDPREKRVRAFSKVSGYLIRPYPHSKPVLENSTASSPSSSSGNHNNNKDEPQRCCLTYLTNTDPSGWLPGFVVNYLTTKLAPSVIVRLRKAAVGYPAWLEKQGPKYERSWITVAQSYDSGAAAGEQTENDKRIGQKTIAFAAAQWGAGGAGAVAAPVEPPTPSSPEKEGAGFEPA